MQIATIILLNYLDCDHKRTHTPAQPFLRLPHCEISVAHPQLECARLVPPMYVHVRRQGANLNFKQEQQRNLISVENASEISRLFPNCFRARLHVPHPSLRPQEISRRRRPWQLPLSLRKRYIISLLCCERRGGRTDSIINYSALPLSRKHRAARVLPMVRGDMLCQEQRGSSDEDTIYSATGSATLMEWAHMRTRLG